MDVTLLAATLLEPIPANRLFGIEVLRAGDAGAEVGLSVTADATNVIGALHSSGLVAIVDAAGLAAIAGALTRDGQLDDVVPLGTVAHVEFLAPARGRLVGRCTLDDDARRAMADLLERRTGRARLNTTVEVLDDRDRTVCRGTFIWSLRRGPT